MKRNGVGFLAVIALCAAACNSGSANDTATADNSAATPSGGAKKDAARESKREAASFSAPSGTNVDVTISDSISSRLYSAGHMITGTVAADVMDRGKVVIAAGAPVSIEITKISPSEPGDTKGEGTLELTVRSVTVGGSAHEENVVVRNVPHIMKGRGITKGEATDVGVGAAAGALVGQLVGKNTKGTVIGGAVGAAAGAGVAVKGAQRDIIVAPGTRISFALATAIAVK